MSEKLKKLLALLLALVIWQILAAAIQSTLLLPTPVSVLIRLTELIKEADFLQSLLFTMGNILAGFFLAWILGILLAAASCRSDTIRILLWPWMAVVRSVPVASFVVICLIWLSPARLSVFISFLIVLPFVYQNLLEGLKNRNAELLASADILGLDFRKRLAAVTLPELRPYILSAFRVTAGLAWKAGIAAEIIGTPGGSIGKSMYLAKLYLEADELLAWTLVVIIISVLIEKAGAALLERWLPHA